MVQAVRLSGCGQICGAGGGRLPGRGWCCCRCPGYQRPRLPLWSQCPYRPGRLLLWRDCLWQHAVVAVNRLRFAVAQLGRRAGARDALACLLGVEDLRGAGWRVLDERTWRTGVAEHAAPWGGQARAAGSVTAWRSFQDAAGRRWVWVQVMPLVSAQDALDALGGIGCWGTRVPRSKGCGSLTSRGGR